jgi:DNA-binding transcriptional ArsR family regulator
MRNYSFTKNNDCILISYSELKKVLVILKSIDHDLRKKIINLLHENSTLTVTQLFLKLKIEQSVTSQHLGMLKELHLLNAEREGKNVYYKLNKEKIKTVDSFLSMLSSVENQNAKQVSSKKGNDNLILADTIQDKKLKDVILQFYALCHPLRLSILEYLHKMNEVNVNTIFKDLNLEQSITSQHLSLLRKTNLVNSYRDGKKINYSVNFDKIKQLINAIPFLVKN